MVNVMMVSVIVIVLLISAAFAAADDNNVDGDGWMVNAMIMVISSPSSF